MELVERLKETARVADVESLPFDEESHEAMLLAKLQSREYTGHTRRILHIK